MESFRTYLNRDEKPLIIFDGGTGTSFQNLNLTADDFGGKELEGCNENLVLSSPKVVEKVHNSFLEAGCHVIETNTFGASSIVLDEYDIADKAYEINKNAVLIADEVFLTGTAAKITPVKKIESSELNGQRPIMNKLKSKLIEITEGRSQDYDNWVTRISLK